ncbi:uncharacterized protein BDW43DRAFT_283699 [Aspergillus alliaceus]|uniref:uncharacterized protein n=1 Tax=Petromyces alliaceus TaxID=209559 RepID=UPI0012A43FC9|nr:uncharacterized protein BDW43DRAFT_283699 [Aspergillus alliaceus]KAB8230900.1 hypothetical protein BDW43DRAFT_283699 [Aspergillus alliaceus]
MKYSMLSIVALVAPTLGNPAYYWRQYLSRPIHPANAGDVIVHNYISSDVDVDVEPQGIQFTLHPGQGQSVPGAPVADVKFNQEVEVSYVSGDQGTFNYVIQPIGGNFDGCVYVSPQGCGTLSWCSGDPASNPVTCPDGTTLPVNLYPSRSRGRKTAHEFLL